MHSDSQYLLSLFLVIFLLTLKTSYYIVDL
nr:MAG TPA: hypothetical protein [Caudoviricetes sp.]